jgi:hypothetical protein
MMALLAREAGLLETLILSHEVFAGFQSDRVGLRASAQGGRTNGPAPLASDRSRRIPPEDDVRAHARGRVLTGTSCTFRLGCNASAGNLAPHFPIWGFSFATR